jgi:hypothetical protein
MYVKIEMNHLKEEAQIHLGKMPPQVVDAMLTASCKWQDEKLSDF